MEARRQIADFIARLPQLRSKYDQIVPLSDAGGAGQNSLVFKAKKGRRNIILKFNGPWSDEYRRRSFEREFTLLDKLRGEKGVIQILGKLEHIKLQVSAEDGGVLLPYTLTYYPMEMARTDVATMIHSRDRQYSVLEMLILFRAACRGVRRVHNLTICHRDLKPSNLFVFGPEIVKIGDFGTARQLGESTRGILDTYDFPRGDVLYTAPELLCGVRECDEGFLDGDLYSLGTILFEMLTGRVFGNLVYSLEYLRELAATFTGIKATSREEMFQKILPDIIESHPLPNLWDITTDIPRSILERLDMLCKNMTDARVDRRWRLCDYDRLFGQLEILIRILKWEQKVGREFPWHH